MGIKHLYKYISDNNLDVVKNKKFFKNKVVAIDISILLYQSIIGTRIKTGTDYLDKQGNISSHILGLFNKIIIILKNNIIPIFVFDGKSPKLKENVIKKRRKRKLDALIKITEEISDVEKIKYLKKSVFITSQQIKDCKELLDIMGIPYIQSIEEADSQCAYLNKMNLVNGVLTDDMDILTFGSKYIYRNLYSLSKKPSVISLDEVLNFLDLNFDEFVDLCILLGSDYGKKINVDYITLIELFKKTKDISKCLLLLNNNKIKTDELEKYLEIKEYFNNPNVKGFSKNLIKLKKIDMKKLEIFLVNRFGFCKQKLLSKLNYLEYRNLKFNILSYRFNEISQINFLI
jgi:flap endonuclease-1